MTVPTSRKESLLSGSHTTTREQQRKAALNVVAMLGYPPADDPELIERLQMLGLLDYDAPKWRRVHGPKVRREAS